MKISIRPSRLIALVTALVLASGALSTSSAQARPISSKDYKTGATVLGAVGGYLITKGKVAEGAAVLAGGYAAQKKGEKVAQQERYGSYGDPRYGYNNGNDNYGYNNGDYGTVYPDGGYGDSNYGYNTNDRDYGLNYRGNADFRPEQPGNNGHHYGQYKFKFKNKSKGKGKGHGKKHDRDDD